MAKCRVQIIIRRALATEYCLHPFVAWVVDNVLSDGSFIILVDYQIVNTRCHRGSHIFTFYVASIYKGFATIDNGFALVIELRSEHNRFETTTPTQNGEIC